MGRSWGYVWWCCGCCVWRVLHWRRWESAASGRCEGIMSLLAWGLVRSWFVQIVGAWLVGVAGRPHEYT